MKNILRKENITINYTVLMVSIIYTTILMAVLISPIKAAILTILVYCIIKKYIARTYARPKQ